MSKIFIVIGGIFAVVLALGALWYYGIIGNGDRHLLWLIRREPALVELFHQAVAKEQAMRERPDDAKLYFDAGLAWKSVAEQSTRDQLPFFLRSLAVYEKGIDRFGQKNILFYLNGGNLAEHARDYAKAERYYQKVIELSPGDETGYLNLASLYEHRLVKPPEAVLAVYERGLQTLINNLPVVQARGSYLQRLGRPAEALKDYETLLKAFPNNAGYQQIVLEIKATLAK